MATFDSKSAFDLSKLATKKEEHKVLILACKTCRTFEEIPVDERWPINQQRDNLLLARALEAHQKPAPHMGLLVDVDFAVWNSESGKKAMAAKMFTQSEGLGEDVYAAKDNYSADAMKCFTAHNRPEGQCADYKSGAKLIKIEVMKDERRDAGLSTKDLPSFYLCDFCPVKSFNMMKSNQTRGLYT
jgi:hypothetical protein